MAAYESGRDHSRQATYPHFLGAQLSFETEWTDDRIEENKLVNDIRRRVGMWRKGKYLGVTSTTARLLAYWNDPNRDRKLFFCQIEALETAIYLTEAASKYGDAWIENVVRAANDTSNPSRPLEEVQIRSSISFKDEFGAQQLRAISLGAVFMGAVTYIGNGPNFMVKSIVEERRLPMPSFVGFMGWSLVILFPLFLLVTWIFLV